MKKFLVLLIAAAVAAGASAGIKLTNNTKANVKDLKAMNRQSMMFKKGDAKVMPSMQLNAFESFITKSNHALKDGDTYFWDFEDEAQVNDWVVLDEDGDGFNWELITGEGLTTHSGAYVMSSASYDNPSYTALTPDNWLVSPWVPLHGSFAFYACGQDPSYAAEVFGVYIYTSANSEWVQLGEDITATGVMKAYEFDLSEYEGLEGSLAIVHHNVTDMFRLNVDDITIGDFEAEPEPETPT
ncbi:MAG: choice-of-anchor J domain-containing protein [Muribaculaceae bacterium]|nr:choice-of-anchor J domain-containing protein [Muribaculaceae bacterium]